jgi:molybdenum cofactor biosynthesis protein B
LSKVSEHHKANAPRSIGLFILTCSTSRFRQRKAGEYPEDRSGDIIERLATSASHRIEGRTLVTDSKTMISKAARQAFSSKKVDVLIITGGTGVSPRDVTIESISPFITKEIPGFGELFRKVSFDKIGSAAILSRAVAGLVKDKVVFCLPGSPNAVQTAMKELILPELGHVVRIAREH